MFAFDSWEYFECGSLEDFVNSSMKGREKFVLIVAECFVSIGENIGENIVSIGGNIIVFYWVICAGL